MPPFGDVVIMGPFRRRFHPACPECRFRLPGAPRRGMAGDYLENDSMFRLPSTFFFMNLLTGMETFPT